MRPWGCTVAIILALLLTLGAGGPNLARASTEDVAMFYDELARHGEWFEYDNYGPVWRPKGVDDQWRPYTHGRWTPTQEGYVFETQEPWGWATYHYGNWMPTQGYGWVWAPGRTWYPNTVAWRTTPENAPEDEAYIGWAPVPPPNYQPPPEYAPTDYKPGSLIADVLTAPLYVFVAAAKFLAGLGQAFAPPYSYEATGAFAPPAYVPVFYSRTFMVPGYVMPAYYGPAMLGMAGAGPGGLATVYSWGPPNRYVARMANINQTVINQAMITNSANIVNLSNVRAPVSIIQQNAALRQVQPAALTSGRPLPAGRMIRDAGMARGNLLRPDMAPAPKLARPFRAEFPRVQAAALGPGQGVAGMGLPSRAVHAVTPDMSRRMAQLPSQPRLIPGKPLPVSGTARVVDLGPDSDKVRKSPKVVDVVSAGPARSGITPPGAAAAVPYRQGANGAPSAGESRPVSRGPAAPPQARVASGMPPTSVDSPTMSGATPATRPSPVMTPSGPRPQPAAGSSPAAGSQKPSRRSWQVRGKTASPEGQQASAGVTTPPGSQPKAATTSAPRRAPERCAPPSATRPAPRGQAAPPPRVQKPAPPRPAPPVVQARPQPQAQRQSKGQGSSSSGQAKKKSQNNSQP
jgi:hypothetical protein